MENATKQDEVSKSELIERLGADYKGLLARWQGWTVFDQCGAYLPPEKCPDYLNDDAAAMSLLDTLVEKGIGFVLEGWDSRRDKITPQYCLEIFDYSIQASGSTRREAVLAGVLELISKEP